MQHATQDCDVVGVVDEELSRAVVVYLRGSGLAWPHTSPEAVAKELDGKNDEIRGAAATVTEEVWVAVRPAAFVTVNV